MCDERTERNLDAELRNVELPQELLTRLKQVTQPTDDEIDSALCSLPIPNGLVGRVKFAVADELLDESLREIEIPENLLARLRVIPRIRSASPVRRFVLAASLLLVMTGSFFGLLGGLLASIRPLAGAATSLLVIDVGPTRLVALPPEPVRISTAHSTNPFDVPTVPVVWKGGPLEVELVRLDATTTPGPAGQLIRDVERGLVLDSDVLLMRWDAYASPQHASQRLPELEQIRRVPDAGVDLPLVEGYDRSFLLRSATHPPVFIAANEQLQTIRVPLSTSMSSVRRTEQLVELGRVPDQQEIRPEDFLAMIDVGLTPPTDEDVSVVLAAGPAVFGTEKHSLLQVGVKTARRLGSFPTHLSVVADVSQSMRHQRRLDTLRESLQTMFEHLGPEDSISLVAVNHEVTQQIDFATAEQQDQLAMWLRALRAGGGDRLVVGVQSALSLALEAARDKDVVRQVVVVTDGAARLQDDERQQLGELLAVAAEGNVRTMLLQLGDDASLASPPREAVTSFATVTSDQLRWTLVELVTGVSSMVARQAHVQVVFNPKAVRAYRLVGHGPAAVTGLADEPWATDLRSAQDASLLFEVWMHESYEDEVVSATVHWIAPDSGEAKQRRAKSLTRYDVATISSESAPSLQAAAFAAEIGERLRGVGTFELRGERGFREQRKPVGWKNIIDAAAEVGPEVAAREDFRRLIELARKMEELRRRQRPKATL
ncbi:MAG: VWA domain-containing protein [Planctomycetota bacterium]|nr:VWA domain-containing protein [Planctomycetota bacterium]